MSRFVNLSLCQHPKNPNLQWPNYKSLKIAVLVKLGFSSLQMERTAGQSSGSNSLQGNWQKVQRFPEFLEQADKKSTSSPK